MILCYSLILESHEVHGLECYPSAQERFLPNLGSSPKLFTRDACSFQPRQFTGHRLIENLPVQSSDAVAQRLPSSLRDPGRAAGAGWSHSSVRVEIRMGGVSSLLRASYKFHLRWSREIWNGPANWTLASSPKGSHTPGLVKY